MNSLYTFTHKRARVLCLRFNKVCLEFLSYLKCVSHVINIPHLLSLYGENIGPPGLGSRDRASSLHAVNRIYILESVSFSDYSKPVVTLH